MNILQGTAVVATVQGSSIQNTVLLPALHKDPRQMNLLSEGQCPIVRKA